MSEWTEHGKWKQIKQIVIDCKSKKGNYYVG
jgi:hypothetical protein